MTKHNEITMGAAGGRGVSSSTSTARGPRHLSAKGRNMTERESYISGLRKFANWLEANPEIKPNAPTLSVECWDKDQLTAIVRAMPKPIRKMGTGDYFYAYAKLDGLEFWAAVNREDVCERVTRRETVTVMRPAPGALEVPMVEVEETREIVEWDCGDSILAENTGGRDGAA